MYRVFIGATAFNVDIGRWNIANAQVLAHMFFGCRKFNADIIDSYSNCLLALISCERQAFSTMVAEASSRQPSDIRKQRLSAAFEKLVSENNVQLGVVSRTNRRIFQKNMRQFLENVRGFVNSQ